ncbi:hypothetical protein [Christiangramia sp. LLG6405-1]|uniref:hypothetical protein n=1 Tax=Christiangramia sp. LLG6405-1 TaxID=3160832 RepID=UPI00386EC0B8
MHQFQDLANRGITFTLRALDELNSKIIDELQTHAPTSAVKNLQMIQLQKAILAIGMYSLFESILQQQLKCKNGFKKAKELLMSENKNELLNQFNVYYLAINVLKHGKGKSYETLISKTDLPFQIKKENQYFFCEGDVSEVSTLILVDNDFVIDCANIIEKVSKEIDSIQNRTNKTTNNNG